MSLGSLFYSKRIIRVLALGKRGVWGERLEEGKKKETAFRILQYVREELKKKTK